MKKRILSLILVFAFMVSMTPSVAMPALAADQTATLGYSVQSTVAAAGVVTSNLPDRVGVGGAFNVVFDKTSFKWSATGDGTYNIGLVTSSWVKLEGAVLLQDFSITALTTDPTTGSTTVTFTALRPFNGNFKVFLNSGAGATNAFQKSVVVVDTPAQIVKTRSGGTAPTNTTPAPTLNITTGGQLVFQIPADNFDWNPPIGKKDASSLKDTSWILLGGASLASDFTAKYTTQPGADVVTVTLTAIKPATYNNVSLSLRGGSGAQTAVSAPQTVVVTASGDSRMITGIADGAFLGGDGALLNGKAITYNQLSSLDVRAGDEVLIPLTAGLFTWDGTPPFAGTAVTTAQLRRAKIQVTVAKRSGGQVLTSSSPKIVNQSSRAYISIAFNKDIITTKEINFSLSLFLSVNKRRHHDSRLEIEGILDPQIITVYDDDYFDISDGSVIEANNSIRKVELYLGNGVTVKTNLISGKRYSGVASSEIGAEDEWFLGNYPSIDQVLTIKTNTLNRSNDKYYIDAGSSNYFVYDSDGKFLGRTNSALPYSSKYYLSTKELDIDLGNNNNNNSGDGDDFIEPLPGDGDYSLPNVNANPGTGR